jgi:hypothetical protein
MLNIVIRTSYRPQAYYHCLKSIIDYLPLLGQVKIIVGYDNPRALEYIDANLVTTVDLTRHPRAGQYYYNLYLNKLLEDINEGWVLFVDDDDEVIKYSLEVLISQLQPGRSSVIPFIRGGHFQKPTELQMRLKKLFAGYVGLPCLVLWHEHKKLITFDATELSDFKAIKKLSEAVDLLWISVPVVCSQARGYGRIEK